MPAMSGGTYSLDGSWGGRVDDAVPDAGAGDDGLADDGPPEELGGGGTLGPPPVTRRTAAGTRAATPPEPFNPRDSTAGALMVPLGRARGGILPLRGPES